VLGQVTLPIATVEGAPVGLGLVGPRGSDEQLLQLTERLMAVYEAEQ
jgi:amidase